MKNDLEVWWRLALLIFDINRADGLQIKMFASKCPPFFRTNGPKNVLNAFRCTVKHCGRLVIANVFVAMSDNIGVRKPKCQLLDLNMLCWV